VSFAAWSHHADDSLKHHSLKKVNWASEYSPSMLHSLWQEHTPSLPDRRLSTIDETEWFHDMCGSWLIPYLEVVSGDRVNQDGSSSSSNNKDVLYIPPTSESHGIGDWEMMALYSLREAVKKGQRVVVDWPDMKYSSSNRNGPIKEIELYNTSLIARNARSFGGIRGGGGSVKLNVKKSDPIVPLNPTGDACLYKYFLAPSTRMLSYTERARSVLADPHALTIGIHIRCGAADGHVDSRKVDDEIRENMELARTEWPVLIKNAIACALAYEDQWYVGSTRKKVVWLLVGDGGSELPNIVESFIKELRILDKMSTTRQFLTGSSGLSSGLHTGVIYQHSDLARSLDGGYPLTLLSAFSDQMLLSSCDFLVTSSGSVVSGTSGFALGAARRGGRSKHSFCVTKPGFPTCTPVCAQSTPKYPC
jgi:hypothetical protein